MCFQRSRPNRYAKIAFTTSEISPDGQILAEGCSWDSMVQVWSVADGKRLIQFESHSHGIIGLTFSPDANLLAGLGTDGVVWVWHLPDQTLFRRLKGRKGEFGIDEVTLTFSPDGQLLSMTGLFNGVVNVWHLLDETLLHSTNRTGSWLASANGQILVTANLDDVVQFWSLSDKTELPLLEKQTQEISSLAITPDGLVLAIGNKDGTIQLWKLWKAYLPRWLSRSISFNDLYLIQEILQQKHLTEAERQWLEFLLALARWQKRFEVELGEAPKDIPGGEFDVEIEA